jgi:hypothetical protein
VASGTPGEAKEGAPSKKTPRHSGLDPESSSFFKLQKCGASRRRKRFWIPDQVRNDEVLWVSPGVGLGIVRRSSRKAVVVSGFPVFSVSPYRKWFISGFRIKSGMTSNLFASPGVGLGIARRNSRKTVLVSSFSP